MSEQPPSWQKTAGNPVRSLRDLPQQMRPPHDLWPQIEARLAQTEAEAQTEAAALRMQPRDAPAAPFSGWRARLAAAVGLLALGAALTTGVRLTHRSATDGHLGPAAGLAGVVIPQIQPLDARARASLLRSLNARLQSLPSPSRRKVLADLSVIEQSMQDIQSALGRDPGNALLREMLLESFQDEQRLIATVQEAGVWTEEAGSGKGSI